MNNYCKTELDRLAAHMKDCTNTADGPAFEEKDEPIDVAQWVMNAGIALLVIALITVSAFAYSEKQEAQQRVSEHQASAQRYASMLATCLNGDALLDKTSGKGFFCAKAIEVQL